MLLHLGRSCLTQLCRGRKEGREIKYRDIYFLFLFAGDVQGPAAPSTEEQRCLQNSHWKFVGFGIFFFGWLFFCFFFFYLPSSCLMCREKKKEKFCETQSALNPPRGFKGGFNFSIFPFPGTCCSSSSQSHPLWKEKSRSCAEAS